MPGLKTKMHTRMLERSRREHSLPRRLYRALRRELFSKYVYGLEWGDPDVLPPLKFIRDRWVIPYVRPDHTAVEIGPGGGRWTRYLLGFERLYLVDYHEELLSELRKNFNGPNLVFVKNAGTDLPGIPEASIDYFFSFGCFVHLEAPLIESYLAGLKQVLKPGGNAVIQYSDMTKVMAQHTKGFAQNTPDRMRAMLSDAGFSVVEEDLTTMWHSSLVRFTQ